MAKLWSTWVIFTRGPKVSETSSTTEERFYPHDVVHKKGRLRVGCQFAVSMLVIGRQRTNVINRDRAGVNSSGLMITDGEHMIRLVAVAARHRR
jgi:hypothetical protein